MAAKTAEELGLKRTSWVPEHWGDKEIDVWKSVDGHWDLLINKKVDEFIKYIHPDMIGFGHEAPTPVDYPWLYKWVGFWTKTTNIAIAEIRPIQMKFHAPDLVILQYIIYTVEVNAEGGKRVVRRYTMTWKKNPQLGIWQVIGSHNNLMDETLKG